MTADPTTPGQAVVQITLGQVYQQVFEMRGEMRDLTGAVKTIGDHETRIRTLERRIYTATGVAAVLGAGAGYAITLWSSAH